MSCHATSWMTATALGITLALAGVPDDVPGVGETGGPLRPLTGVEMRQWMRGRGLFDKDFHRADGVGLPEFNADSCRACHQDPVLGGAGGLELNVSRFGNDNGGAGPFTNLPGGQGLSKLRPPWVEGRENYDPLTADVFEQRQTPLTLGLGLIESISEAEILSHQDPGDTSPPDGIRGVARLVDAGGSIEVGRLGWKAQVPRITDFIRDAMGGECGITTPDDGRGFAFTSDADTVADPELSQAQINDMEFFLALLAPPKRKGSTDPAVAAGEALFDGVGCNGCHRVLQGVDGPVALYSDLLLHDVAQPGFHGMAEDPDAPSGTYRTPPLWGISDTAPYMHDGRSETLAAAIAEHAGEASGVVAAYDALTPGQQADLLAFLADL